MAGERRRTHDPKPQVHRTDKRERVAIFLGAGASKAFGYPLTSDLLPDLRDFLRDGTLEQWGYSTSERDTLREGLRALFPGIRRIQRNKLPLITDILTLIDHSVRTGSSLLQGWPNDRVAGFRLLLEQVIADMVGPEGMSTSKQQKCLKQVVRAITRSSQRHRLGIVTTNYDLEIELELFRHFGTERVADSVDFGMSWRDPGSEHARIYQRPANPKLSLYKLHGSLNWLRCPMCEYIYINVEGVIVGWAADPGQHDANTCHCGHWPLQSVLVTPSYVRDSRDVNLAGIWRHSLDLLANADRWILIGYSMPAEDFAIRSLLMKAYSIRNEAADRKPLRIWIVQRDTRAKPHYTLLFPNVETYHARGIETFDFTKALR
jgi:hypothetical protein